MNEVIIRCPVCGDKESHYHCSVSVERGLFHCYLCNAGGTLEWLMKRYPKARRSLYLTEGLSAPPQTPQPSLATEDVQPLLSSTSLVARAGIRYLRMRGLTEDEIVSFGVCVRRGYPNYMVFPDLEGGLSRFWCARNILSGKYKWMFPAVGETSLRKSEAVWGLPLQQKGGEVWITEGIFDAVAVSGVAIYGKVPSASQIRAILRLGPTKLVIGLDNDAKQEALDLQAALRAVVSTYIQHPPESVKDYGELLKKGIRRISNG